MKIICVIPARYNSSRFPGKPLADILGKPMIWWVYNAVSKMPEVSETYVATDDERIFYAACSFGAQAVMTGACATGTDRVAEVCRNLDFDIVLNIQGDEPMIRSELVLDLISAFDGDKVQMATLRKRIENEAELHDSNIAKVVVGRNGDALYFTRSAVPHNRDGDSEIDYFKQIGVYGYRKEFLDKFVSLPQSPLEKAECLEQLRALENGYAIRTVETSYQSIGVDIPEHISAVERKLMLLKGEKS